MIPATYFTVGEVVNLLADVGDVGLRFVVRSATSNVVVGFRQANDGAFQPDEDRVCQSGMVGLWVIA